MAQNVYGVMAFPGGRQSNWAAQREAADRAFVHMVSGNYFTVLGAQPMMGRLFLPDGVGR